MNVLFLTVSTGQGHTSCGKALETCLIKGGASTYFLDLYSYIHPFLGKAISEIYLLASGKTPKLYGKYYDKEDFGRGKVMNVVSNFNRIIKSDIIKYIKANKIDVVICTHLFSGQVMTLIKDNIGKVGTVKTLLSIIAIMYACFIFIFYFFGKNKLEEGVNID